MLSCTLSRELSTDAVTAVDAEDRDGDGEVASEAESDEVNRVEMMFLGVVSDIICWVSEDKLARVEPDKKYFSCKVCGENLETCEDFVTMSAISGKTFKAMQIVKASMNNRLTK